MACFSSCRYCPGTVCGGSWHTKCRLAFAEDLLAQIRLAVANGKATDLPDGIKEKIRTEDWGGLPVKKKLEDLFKEGDPKIF